MRKALVPSEKGGWEDLGGRLVVLHEESEAQRGAACSPKPHSSPGSGEPGPDVLNRLR